MDEYIASQPKAVHHSLEQVCYAIRKALPFSGEVITYNMPTYKILGSPVLNFAAWNQHHALYAATGFVYVAFKDELAPYEVSKGTIRFPFGEPVPVDLIERIAKFRAQEVLQRTKTSGKSS